MTLRWPSPESGFFLLIPAIALSFFPWVSNPFALKQDFTFVLFSAALLWWVRGAGGSATGFAPSPTARTAGLLAGAAACSNWSARNPSEAWLSFSLLAFGLLLFSFGHLRLWSPAFPQKFCNTVFWTSFPISLLGIAQGLFPGRLDFGLQALGKMAVFSTLGNPLFVAAWLVFSLALYPAVGFRRIGPTIVAVAALACLVLSRSASGLLALAAAGLLAVLFKSERAGFRRIHALIGLLLFASAAYLGWSSHTGRGRIMIWIETFLIWIQHPWFGVGLGQYNIHQLEAQHRFFALGDWTQVFHQNASFVLDAHNQYFQILAEQGLVGFGLFAFLIYAVIRSALRKSAEGPQFRALATGGSALLVFFLWNAPLFYSPIAILFWTTAGILHPGPEPMETRERSLSLSLGAAVILLCASSVLFLTKLHSGVLEKQGDALLERGPFPAAVDRFEETLRWAPQNGYAWEKLALAHFFNGNHEAALASLRAAKARFGDVGILYLEAEILAREKDYLRAIPRFEFIRDAFPQHVTPSFALGQIFKLEGDYDRAERELVRVLRLPDSSHNLKLNRRKIEIQKELAFRFLAEIRRLR